MLCRVRCGNSNLGFIKAGYELMTPWADELEQMETDGLLDAFLASCKAKGVSAQPSPEPEPEISERITPHSTQVDGAS